jgi:Putative lactococcus lactis phage r1t holin
MKFKVKEWGDFFERVVWTAIQAFAGVLLATLLEGNTDWKTSLYASGIAALISALKVIVGQNTGVDDTGAVKLPIGSSSP